MTAFIVYNIFNLFVFGALAFVFEKWWIVLFALLFVLVPAAKRDKKKCRICDCCGRASESADTIEEAVEIAQLRGWVHIEDFDTDFCPECIHRIKEEEMLNEMGHR